MYSMTVVLQTWIGQNVLTMLVARFLSNNVRLTHIMNLMEYLYLIFLNDYVKQIRAGHLSGDCHFKRELLKLTSLKIQGHEQVR